MITCYESANRDARARSSGRRSVFESNYFCSAPPPGNNNHEQVIEFRFIDWRYSYAGKPFDDYRHSAGVTSDQNYLSSIIGPDLIDKIIHINR